MTPRKKQHQKWDGQLAKLLINIILCELCHKRPATDKSHRLKRRFIGWRTEDDRLEYFTAAKLCRSCHISLDEAKTPDAHEIMFKVITEIVVKRWEILLVGPKPWPPFIDWDPVRIYNYSRD